MTTGKDNEPGKQTKSPEAQEYLAQEKQEKEHYIRHLLRDFKTGWENFSRADVLSDEKNISLLLSVLRRKFNTKIEFLYGYPNFAAIKMDLSEVKIRLSVNTLVCFIRIDEKSGATTSEAFRHLTTSHYADGIPGYTTIALAHGDTGELKKRCKNALQDSVILSSNLLEEVISADLWVETLAEILREDRDADILSPYDEIGVCSPELFIGRAKEMAKLTSHARGHGYCLVGPRRVGKSSLLLRIKNYYSKINQLTFYIDCQTCYSGETLYEEIVKRTNPRDLKNRHLWSLKGYLIRLAGTLRGPVNLFLDEIDRVVADDKKSDYQLMRELLSAEATEKIPFKLWMVGFKDLYKAVTGRTGPLFGKTRGIDLGPLSTAETERLVMQPMTHMGFTFDNGKKAIRRIYEETSGHPAFIQLYCRLLVDEMVAKGARKIKTKHLDAVYGHKDLQNYLKDTFVKSTSPLEKIIVLSVLDRNHFTQQEIYESLQQKYNIELRYEPLYDELQDLRLTGVFRQKDGSFTFQYPVMKKIIKEYENPRYIEAENIEDAREIARRINERSKKNIREGQ
ncbi:MAG: ATP-binding protein [Candidatus Aminicenantes bacterium]|nr:ATP-binding protein [Candidatus Aminicenantes bacterium]